MTIFPAEPILDRPATRRSCGRNGMRNFTTKTDDKQLSLRKEGPTLSEPTTWGDIDLHRRHFLGAAAMIAAAQLSVHDQANAQAGKARLSPVSPGTHTSFGPLKQ